MKLYAYHTPDIPKHDGYLKIGETNGSVEERVKQQGRELDIEKNVAWQDAVITERTSIDKRLRRFLKEQGFQVRQFGTGHDTEWVKCTVGDIERAFEIVKRQIYDEEKQREEVGNQFYLEIRNWFYWTTQDNHSIDADYALRLVIRLLFCFFLREKNELVPKELLDQSIEKYLKSDEEHSYYKGILRNLFFHSINTPDNRKYENEKLLVDKKNIRGWFSAIPFLNGGLFDVHEKDDIPIGNDYFFSQKKTRHLTELGETCDVYGVVTILSKYQYKLSLDDLLDQAEYGKTVDPEFIGKVFESLLSCIYADSKKTRQKITGSYYTPREIVDYMVNTSLDAYLETKRQTNTESSDTELLLQCKILDPACGSGAFPCEVMNIIMHRIEEEKKEHENRGLFPHERYRTKLKIVRDVIYGVDIQPMAVQITLLRFFLSLIQDITPDKQKKNYGIDPLPNLEIKFVCANTLIPLVTDRKDAEGRYQKMLEDPIIRNTAKLLRENRDQYFAASMIDRKREIQQTDQTLRETLAIAMESNGMITHDTTKKMAAWNPYDQSHSASFFDAGWMFGINDDFDIVIGNPPYIGEDGHKFIFEPYKKSPLGKRFYCGKMDIFYFFFHVGLDLLKEKGILNFITTNYYLTADGAKNLRVDMYNRSEILELINFNELKVFESAQGQHNIITLLRRADKPENGITKQALTNNKGKASAEILKRVLSRKDDATIYTEVLRDKLFECEKKYIRFSAGIGIDSILDKITKSGRSLGRLFATNQGVVPGALTFSREHALKFPEVKAEKNAPIFIFPAGRLHEICGHDLNVEIDYIKPFFKNSDISRYVSKTETGKELLYSDGKVKLPTKLLTYLQKFRTVLAQRRECTTGKIKWFELQWARTRNLFEKPKIVAPYRCKRATFAYNEIPFYASTDVYYITESKNNTDKLKALLGILNSTLVNVWLYHRGKRKGEMLELFSTSLQRIPIILPKDMRPLVNLVTRRLNGELVDDKIDALVYELYGLTDVEIAIVEGGT